MDGTDLIAPSSARLAIMQPYIFPYIGYFHLIEASDLIVFYDDVNYIKQGWINRNRILMNDKDYLFTVPLKGSSSNKLINEIPPIINTKWKNSFYKQLTSSYRKAPFFSENIDRIMSVFDVEYKNISDLSIKSIVFTYNYLGINLKYKKSSICSPETKGMEKSDRLIEIAKKLKFINYLNQSGGNKLYSKDYFNSKGINLDFLYSKNIEYEQFGKYFVPCLSIIDVLMFNSKDKILQLFSCYEVL